MDDVEPIYVETPVKVEKGDFLVVDDVQEKGCHCGTRKYVVQLVKKGDLSLKNLMKTSWKAPVVMCNLYTF